jgi:uncharacterized phage protein gp47/JayE
MASQSNIQIQSFNQLLGAMLRTIIANTPLNDINQGSVLLTLLEAAAANDFENSTAALSLLNLLNIATVSGSDLDNRAADYGLTRYAATQASGNVSIFNTSIKLQSTNLYILKPPPIASQTVIYVNNTAGWASSGTLYIGRGTISFEGPIPYSSIDVFPTFSQINLSSALQNNHLASDTVINSQGQPDRVIAAGTVVSIPANNQNPQINYTTLRDATLPSGNTEVDNIPVIAQVAGSIGNAPINTVVQFQTSPFPGAAVSNTSALSGGADVETDQDLRDRINQYPNTLARGTEAAILAAVINVSDSTDNKQVASAIIQEPPAVDEPSILYIDDGTGFQPSFAGQSVDNLLINASGKEEFLQLANYPVARPQVINTGVGPFALMDNSFLTVVVDGVSETIVFHTSDFVNISTAQVAEIVVAINNQAKNFSARLTNNSANILLYPQAFDAEIIQVLPLQSTDDPTLYANTQFEFPTSQFSFIALYQNSVRLREKTLTAQVETTGFASWNISGPGDLAISVDNTPTQDRTFSLANFPGMSSFALLTLADWVTAFNQQFAGITAVATSTQTMQINSNQSGTNSALNITGGTLLANLFPTQATSSVGQAGQFILNRQTGNLQMLTTINPGDNITAGSPDTRGFAVSAATSSGTYNLSTDSSGRPAEMIVVADSTYCNQVSVSATIGSTVTISNPSGNIMRIMSSSLAAFQNILPGNFIFIPVRTSAWLATGNTGLFKVVDKGAQITAGTDTYIDVLNPSTSITPQVVSVADAADLQAFSTDGYPQLWLPGRLGTSIANPSSAAINDIVTSINTDLINVLASVYQSDAIKVTSTTELNGSIAIPIVIGNATALFTSTTAAQFGNPPLVASIVSSKSLLTYFKIAPPSNVNTFLNRQVFVDSKGALTANAIPDVPPYSGPYSEVLESTGKLNTTYVDYDDYISLTRGNNRDQLRTIAAFNPVGYPTDTVGTQENLARTSLNHVVGDEFEVVKGLQLSSFDTLVTVIDQNPQNNTINVSMARAGQVNSGNGSEPGYAGGDTIVGTFIPTSTEFSATDFDNQPGIDFGNINVWGTTLNDTDFNDYAVWMMARNWYASGGVGSGQGAMIVRADDYGPNGNFMRFNLQYPTIPSQAATTGWVNTPSFTTFTYYFGSGAPRSTSITGGTITIKGPYPDKTTNFPDGTVSTGNYWDYTFSIADLSTVMVGDILSIAPASGISVPNQGQFSIQSISGETARVYNPNGSSALSPEPISNPTGVNIFPLNGNTVAAISAVINSSLLMSATPVGSSSLTISLATQEETSPTLAFDYTPGSNYVSMFDGVNWIKTFENSNPNFTLKTPMVLQGANPAIYSMDTAPNNDGISVGELFKLIPITVQNLYNQLTQAPISQLPIVAIVEITDDRKNIQIESKSLGSNGAVQIVGGTGNESEAFLQSESEVATDGSGSYLEIQVPAFPDTFNTGDTVLLTNPVGVQRFNRLLLSDTMNVINTSIGVFDYTYNAKDTGINSANSFTIVDSGSLQTPPVPPGFVWRWTVDAPATGVNLIDIRPGDLLYAFGSLTGWSQNNQARPAGDTLVSGFPIIGVNVGANWVDVVNPFGVAMASTSVGTGKIQICPSPSIQWLLTHAGYIPAVSLSATSNTVTVTTEGAHFLSSGNSVTLRDSFNVPDGTYGPITVTGPNTFTFAIVIANFTENLTFASVINNALTPTRYRLQSLGFNGLVRMSAVSGQSPNFVNSGVAVDDYISISGNTFSSNNNGLFRVLAVDNSSVIFINKNATDQLNTVMSMNNQNIEAVWTSGTNTVTGVTGTFKYVTVGTWVKKVSDPDTSYLQVESLNNLNPALATSITIGGGYPGTTGSALGTVYDETSGYDSGVNLQNVNDIQVLEGDSVIAGDTLFVQNIVNSVWFNAQNVGSFPISQYGTEPSTYLPFVRVSNSIGIAQSGVEMSVNPGGLYVIESLANKFSTIREITYAVIDGTDSTLRDVYITPYSRSYKFNSANNSTITHLGKIGYSNITEIGIDGYIYYTGLLQKVQRIVDGFEPDITDFPGQRGLGTSVETLPPLPFQVNLSLNIVTNVGVNLGDVSNNIKSVIINYVEGLGVGQSIVLSQIIADVQAVTGVASVVFTIPAPSTASIALNSNEKAIISSNNISIA